MSPAVETCARSQIDVIVLEARIDVSRESAGLIKRESDDVALAFYDSFGHRAFRSKIARFTV